MADAIKLIKDVVATGSDKKITFKAGSLHEVAEWVENGCVALVTPEEAFFFATDEFEEI